MTMGSTSIMGTRARANAYADDVVLNFGSGDTVNILYETADANANALIFVAPEGDGTDVPVFIFGDASILNVDLGFFAGVTEPTIAVINDAKDAYVSLDAGDDAVAGSKGLYFKSAADEDVELINLSLTGTPRIFWDESEDLFASSKGWLMAASKLNGTVTVNDQIFDAGANDVEIDTTGVVALTLKATLEGAGSRVLFQTISTTPAANDHPLRLTARGKDADSPQNDTDYGEFYCFIVDATAGSEDGKWQWNLMEAGADNNVMNLSSTGVLDVDASSALGAATVGLFDKVPALYGIDDVGLLNKVLSENELGYMVDIGLMRYKTTGSGYMLNLRDGVYFSWGLARANRSLIYDVISVMAQEVPDFDRKLEEMVVKRLAGGQSGLHYYDTRFDSNRAGAIGSGS